MVDRLWTKLTIADLNLVQVNPQPFLTWFKCLRQAPLYLCIAIGNKSKSAFPIREKLKTINS